MQSGPIDFQALGGAIAAGFVVFVLFWVLKPRKHRQRTESLPGVSHDRFDRDGKGDGFDGEGD